MRQGTKIKITKTGLKNIYGKRYNSLKNIITIRCENRTSLKIS